MSLYNHVTNKDDVLDGMLDLVLAEMEAPEPEGGLPRSAPRRCRRTTPWVGTRGRPTALTPTRAGIRPRVEFMKALLAALRGAGLSAETTLPRVPRARRAHHRFLALAVDARKLPEDIEDARATFEEMIPVATLPYLHEHGLQHLDEGPHQDVSAFEFALDLLLGGLERLES